MKLFILNARRDLPEKDDPWEPWYNKNFGFVVRAVSEESARKLANNSGGAECERRYNSSNTTTPWLDPKYSTCEELTSEGEECVIMEDYSKA